MAATGTPTPNLGLRIPVGTDPASVDDINYNSNLLDTALGAVGNTSVKDQLDELSDQIASYCTQVQFNLSSPVSVASGAIGQIFSDYNIKTSSAVDTYSNKTLSTLFGSKTIVGVVFLYATGVGVISDIQYTSSGLSLRLYNATSASISVSTVRLLVFAK